MAVRQYIGARYVPKFSEHNGGDWDNSYTYEALEVVKYGNDYYTAKKPVPTGIAITNTAYWVLTGNYNGAISNLQDQIDTINNTDLPAINSSMQSLTSQVGILSNRKYIFIGDSYNTTDTPAGGVPIVPWSNYIIPMLCSSSSEYYNLGMSGAGFVHAPTFQSMLEGLTQTLTADVRNSITDIVVLGGINDGNQSDIGDAVTAFCSYCLTNYPNAHVHIGVISWGGETHRALLRNNVIPAWSTCARRRNASYIDGLYAGMHDYSTHQPDGHPAAAANLQIAELVFNYLKHGTATFNGKPFGGSVTLNSAYSGSMAVTQYFANNIVTMLVATTGLNLGGITITSGTDLTIGTIPKKYINGAGKNTTSILTCKIDTAIIQAQFYINEYELHAIITTPDNSTISSANYLYMFTPVIFEIPMSLC